MKERRTQTDELKPGARKENSSNEREHRDHHIDFEADLRRALTQIECTAQVSQPPLEQMISLVNDIRRHQSRVWRRDLALFMIVSLLIAGGWVISATLNELVDVLVITSAITIVSIPVIWILARREVGAP